MKYAVVLAAAVLGSATAHGGSLGQREMGYAYENLGWEMDLCLADVSACGLTGEETRILTEIRASYDTERQLSPGLAFKSGAQNPGFFIIACESKIAETGSSVGDPIYVNTDLLYLSKDAGTKEAIGVPTATAVLVHEMGHHHGIRDHVKLDILGLKVKGALLNRTQSVENDDLPGIGADLISGGDADPLHRFVLWVHDAGHFWDLSQTVAQATLRFGESGAIHPTGLYWDLPMTFDGLVSVKAHILFNGSLQTDLQFDVAWAPEAPYGKYLAIKAWRILPTPPLGLSPGDTP